MRERIEQAWSKATHELQEKINAEIDKLRGQTQNYLVSQDEELKRFVDDIIAMIERGEKEHQDAIAQEMESASKLKIVVNFRDKLHGMNVL